MITSRETLAVTMPAMHEQVDKRTRSEKHVRQEAEDVPPMLLPEEEPANRNHHANRDSAQTASVPQRVVVGHLNTPH
jgi:hypothetical protein